MKKLEEEARRFMQGRKLPSNPMDDIIKSLENVNKQLETILKKAKELNAKDNTYTCPFLVLKMDRVVPNYVRYNM